MGETKGMRALADLNAISRGSRHLNVTSDQTEMSRCSRAIKTVSHNLIKLLEQVESAGILLRAQIKILNNT